MDELWRGLLGSVLALLVVLALAWGALHAWRRLSRGAGAAGAGAAELQLLRTLALGPRERLVLVRHGDDELLLGVGAAGVRLLNRRAATDASAPAPARVPGGPDGG
ncbi:flagellar biosynthetic protein FliO [Rubrivivax gelatinosus]|nr:flagellar biosynthetic protein FliO [Rubrivivax gelatinosus]